MILLLVHREGLAADFYVNGRNVGQFKTVEGINTFVFLPPYTSYHSLPEPPEAIQKGLTLLDQVAFSTTDKYASAMVMIEQEPKFFRDGKPVTPITHTCPYDLARISTGLSLIQASAQEKLKLTDEAVLTEDEILAAMDYAGERVAGLAFCDAQLEDIEEVSNYETAIASAKAAGLNDAQAQLVQKYFVRMVLKATGRA
jgi:hypothetical protein